jgi:hypothetical protein
MAAGLMEQDSSHCHDDLLIDGPTELFLLETAERLRQSQVVKSCLSIIGCEELRPAMRMQAAYHVTSISTQTQTAMAQECDDEGMGVARTESHLLKRQHPLDLFLPQQDSASGLTVAESQAGARPPAAATELLLLEETLCSMLAAAAGGNVPDEGADKLEMQRCAIQILIALVQPASSDRDDMHAVSLKRLCSGLHEHVLAAVTRTQHVEIKRQGGLLLRFMNARILQLDGS